MSVLNRFNLARGSGGDLPNLVVAQRVLDRMAAAAAHFIEDETGEAMVGLIVEGTHTNGVRTVYLLDTISPDDTALRLMHTFQQGDDRQDELIWWLQENWRAHRAALAPKDKWNVPLRYLGDWHKQPGFMVQPSGGDLMTALDWIDDDDNHMTFLIAPIVTLGHAVPSDPVPAGANFLYVPTGSGEAMRIDFWYIDEALGGFIGLVPTVYPNDQLPTLVPYPWYVLNEALFNREYDALTAHKHLTSRTIWNADSALPLEVCLLVARPGLERLFILVTPHDYPAGAPSIRVAPLVTMNDGDDMQDVFEAAWAQSQPVTLPDAFTRGWTPDRTLLDVIRAAEEAIGLPPEQRTPLTPVAPLTPAAPLTTESIPTDGAAQPNEVMLVETTPHVETTPRVETTPQTEAASAAPAEKDDQP